MCIGYLFKFSALIIKLFVSSLYKCFLTDALNQAAQIAIDTRKKSAKGYENVTKWDSEEYIRNRLLKYMLGYSCV